MKYLFYPIRIIYEVCIALPILLALTVFTAFFTIVTIPWKNSEFVHKEQQIWSRMFYWLCFVRSEVEGLENIEPGKSYVFVSNHQSLFDVWIIYGWLPVVFKWIMKKELRKVPFVGSGCAAAGHIFIDRSHPKAAVESLEIAKKTLVNGVSLVIFPEGTRSKDGEVHAFKRGAFQIAFDMDLPVVPISLSGCHDVMPKGSWIFTPFVRVKMKVGKPIDLKPFFEPTAADAPALKKQQLEAMEYVRQQVLAGKEW